MKDYPKETNGSKIARENRAKCNDLTNIQREELLERGLKMIKNSSMEEAILKCVNQNTKVSWAGLIKFVTKEGGFDPYEVRIKIWEMTASGKVKFDWDWNLEIGDGYAID